MKLTTTIITNDYVLAEISKYWFELPINATVCLLKSLELVLALFANSLGEVTSLGKLHNLYKFQLLTYKIGTVVSITKRFLKDLKEY